MYGLVNQGVKDLVISISNEDTWKSICADANVPSDFVSMQYYDDDITYRLVGAVSSKLSLPPEKVLGEFGKFWITYTAKEGYGPLMDLFGRDFKACLKNLNQLHTRMGMTMPQLSPPSFIYTDMPNDSVQIEYCSKRIGLSPMVQGLLEGLAKKYKVNAEITFSEIEERKIFLIKILGPL